MWLAFWHLEAASWARMVTWFGATTLSVLWPAVLFAITVAVLWVRGGAPAMKAHLKENLAKSFAVTSAGYAALFVLANVWQVYFDHTSMQALPAQVATQNVQIANLNWKISELQRQLEQAQTAALSPHTNPASPPADPDGLYQAGAFVGQFIGERIDEANGQLSYQGLKTFGHFNGAQNADFRNFIVHCDNVHGGPPPGVIAGMYIGMNAGGSCRIVGQKQP
jgi:uncharacterized coiled-coil protein SlyX